MKKFLFNFLLFPCFLFGQNVDSLKLALKNAKHDTTRCNILNAMIEAENDDGIWPIYNEQLKTIADRNLLSKKEFNKIYLKHLAAALNNIGFLANSQGDIPKALDYFHRSLMIQEEINDKRGEAESFNNIGAIYKKQGDLHKALDFYTKGLKIYNEIGNKEGIGTSFNNIAGIYDSQNDVENALDYYYKSLKIREELKDKSGIALAFNNIGYIHYRKANSEKALYYFEESLKIQEEIEDKGGIITSLCNIATLMIETGKANKALSYAERAMKTAKELAFPEHIKNTASALKKIFQKQNKYMEAFEMYELEVKMNDSINNNETQKASIKKQMQYSYEKQEAVAKAEHKFDLDKQQAVAAEKNRKQNIVICAVVGGLILVIVFAGFIFRTLRTTRKQKKLIEIKNKETEEQKQVIEEKQKEILDSIHYAKRIQTALITSEKYIDKSLNKLIDLR